MIEEWSEIEGFDGQYSVSSLGRVRSNYRWHINPMTLTRHKKVRELIMTPNLSRAGYLRIKLSDRKIHFIHRLVASCFCDNGDNKPYVNHIDGNKSNNTPGNLEWVTTQENNQHAWDSGLQTTEHVIRVHSKQWSFRSPQGVVHTFINLNEFCRNNNLTATLMKYVVSGRQRHHKGWTLP